VRSGVSGQASAGMVGSQAHELIVTVQDTRVTIYTVAVARASAKVSGVESAGSVLTIAP